MLGYTHICKKHMSLIKTLNTPLVDLNINSETHPCELHDNVIDFLEVFNLLNSQSEKIYEEKFNQGSLFSQQILDLHSKIIEIHENLDLEEKIISIPQEIYIGENTVEVTYEDKYNDFNKNIECITLRVSSQPWVFSPNCKVACDNALETLKSLNNKLDLIPNPPAENKLKTTAVEKSEVVLEMKEMSPDLVQVNTSDYIVHEYIKYDCSFSQELNIKKYEALSNAVHNQVCGQVKMHNFNLEDSIEIELYPEKLGKVKIKCNIDSDDRIILQVSTEKLTTLALLQQNALELKETIAKNFNDYHQDKTELSFSMSDDSSDNKQNKHNSHNQFPVSDIKTNTIVYFLHNGIVNLVV
jgi:hypothetical protein